MHGEKNTSRSKVENRQQTHLTYGITLGFEPEPHWGEESFLVLEALGISASLSSKLNDFRVPRHNIPWQFWLKLLLLYTF